MNVHVNERKSKKKYLLNATDQGIPTSTHIFDSLHLCRSRCRYGMGLGASGSEHSMKLTIHFGGWSSLSIRQRRCKSNLRDINIQDYDNDEFLFSNDRRLGLHSLQQGPDSESHTWNSPRTGMNFEPLLQVNPPTGKKRPSTQIL